MTSSAPSAVNAFITIAQDALPDNSQVLIGSVFPAFSADVSVLITGINFTEDEYAELGPTYRHEEHYNIICCLYNNGGRIQDEPDIASLMTSTYDLYDDISEAVANSPTLGLSYGTTGFRLAWCRQMTFTPDFDISGYAFGRLEFVVQCQARVTSLD